MNKRYTQVISEEIETWNAHRQQSLREYKRKQGASFLPMKLAQFKDLQYLILAKLEGNWQFLYWGWEYKLV